MFNLNNKGQSLVMFILIIPIFLLIIAMVYDIGNALYEKEALNNINQMVLDYGLDNLEKIDENDLMELIIKNDNNLKNVSITINKQVVTVTTQKKVKGIFGNILGTNITEVVSSYQGKLQENKKIIERIK